MDKETNEEKIVEETKEEPKKEVVEKEVEHPDDKIARANAAAERMETANKKHEELLVKQEAMQVEKTLSGEAEAGQPAEKVDKDQEEADKLMALTK